MKKIVNLVSILLICHRLVASDTHLFPAGGTDKVDKNWRLRPEYQGQSILKKSAPDSPQSAVGTGGMVCPASPKIPEDVCTAMQSPEWKKFEATRANA